MVSFHAHAIKQIHKSYAFRICIVLGYAQQYWFENQQKKPRSYTPLYPFNWTHWINKEQNYMYYVFFDEQASKNPILIWWAWQQIIFILVGQIKQKKLVSFQQLLLGVLNIKYVTISHQPASQIKQKHKTSDFSSLNEMVHERLERWQWPSTSNQHVSTLCTMPFKSLEILAKACLACFRGKQMTPKHFLKVQQKN